MSSEADIQGQNRTCPPLSGPDKGLDRMAVWGISDEITYPGCPVLSSGQKTPNQATNKDTAP